MRAELSIFLAISGLSAACSSDPPTLSIDVTTGQEDDTFSRDPAVTKVILRATGVDGSVTEATTKPGGTFDLGEVAADTPFTFEVEGQTATGVSVVRGRSIGGIAPGAVEGKAIPLFVQRVNDWARPPGGLDRAHVGGAAAIVAERYLMLTGGSQALSEEGQSNAAESDFYDLFALAGTIGSKLARTATTLVALESFALIIDDQGATWVDFTDGATEEAVAPSGLGGFSAVSGGRPLLGPDGRFYVVGATRAKDPTLAVLVVDFDGNLSALRLSEARAGAAAGWVEDVGLVVAAGSKDGAGVEVLGDGATEFASRPFPADATEGAALLATASRGLLLVGGTDGTKPAETRRLDPTCTDDCETRPIDGTTLPVALAKAQAFTLKNERILVVGENAKGTRTFAVDLKAASVEELPLREPRSGSTILPAPNGTLAILGGVRASGAPALSVEMLFPD